MAPRPVLVIVAGTVDDERLAAADLQRAAPESVSVWTAVGSEHTGALRAAPGEWESRVTGFLRTATG